MIDFGNIDERTLVILATRGKINPHSNNFIEIGMVIEGRKPAALVEESVAWFATNHYLGRTYIKMQRVPRLAKREPCLTNYVVYRYEENFDAVCAAWDLYPYDVAEGIRLDENTVRFDIALGAALGYTDTDIARYLKQNYGFEKMKKGLTNGPTSSGNMSGDSS